MKWHRVSLDIRIALPILASLVTSSLRSLSSMTESAGGDGKAEAILLVDADDSYVMAQTQSLRRLGYPYVFRARSAAEALDMLKRLCPTIVLTDKESEGACAWSDLLKRSSELGASTAIVSSQPWREPTAAGVRVFTKAELSDDRFEDLIRDLVAENRAQRRESAWRMRSVAGRTALAMQADPLTA